MIFVIILSILLFSSCSSSVSATIENCCENCQNEEENDTFENNDNDLTSPKFKIVQFGTKENDVVSSVALNDKKIIVVGTTTGAFKNEKNQGKSDYFVAEFSENKLLWLKQSGTKNWDMATGITVLKNGDFFVTGNINGILRQEATEGITNTNVFVSKFSKDGKLLWQKTFGTDKSDFASSITTDLDENIYICGWTYGNFEGRVLNDNSSDIFLFKISKEGKILDKREISSNLGEDKCLGIVSKNNNIFITGTTTGILANNTKTGVRDGFLIKTDNACFIQWIKQFGSQQKDSISGITIKGKEIFISGSTFDNFANLTTSGIGEGFIAKFDLSGELKTVSGINKYSSNEIFAIASNGENVFVTGDISGTLTNQQNSGQRDLFLFSPNNLTIQIGTKGNETGFAIDANLKKVVVGGWTDNQFQNNNNFGKTDAFIWIYYLDD